VRRSYHIDIAAAALLKFEHIVCQLLIADLFALASLADAEVDAEDTAEVAVGEEDSSGAVFAHQAALLAEMLLGAGELYLRGTLADSLLTLEPVDAAGSGTEMAAFVYGVELLDALAELARFL